MPFITDTATKPKERKRKRKSVQSSSLSQPGSAASLLLPPALCCQEKSNLNFHWKILREWPAQVSADLKLLPNVTA